MTNSKAASTANPLASSLDDGAPRVLLMRHAQTFANEKGLFLGRKDDGVTPLGEAQSERAVAGLVSWKPARIMCSPLQRCRKMIAEPAAEELGVELIVDERLIEFDFGPIEGMTFDDVMAKDLPFPWGPRAAHWPCDGGGEPFDEFLQRLSEACKDIEAWEGRTAVVVHGGVIRGMMAHWLSLGPLDINHLIVRNVDSFIFRMQRNFAELESYGIHPEDLANY